MYIMAILSNQRLIATRITMNRRGYRTPDPERFHPGRLSRETWGLIDFEVKNRKGRGWNPGVS